jgi:NTP pyrophosphatase (non-canonical NTP hydrolase)
MDDEQMSHRIETEPVARALFARAAHEWGIRAQIDQAQEEAAELIMALSKVKRAGIMPAFSGAHENLTEEIADVRIMLAQLEQIFGLSEMVNFFIVDKLSRLELRITRSEKENENAAN